MFSVTSPRYLKKTGQVPTCHVRIYAWPYQSQQVVFTCIPGPVVLVEPRRSIADPEIHAGLLGAIDVMRVGLHRPVVFVVSRKPKSNA
jgi:hypothetical protein